jgi:hypothetical protein
MGEGGSSRCWSLLALVTLHILAHSDAAVTTVTTTPIPDPVFPYCTCNDYSCDASPYTLDLYETALAEAAMTRMCFRINEKPGGCGDSPSPCCETIKNNIFKIDLSVGECPACQEQPRWP